MFGYEGLDCCLPAFLERPWLLEGRADARTQVSLTSRLLTWMSRRRMLDMSRCGRAYLETRHTVDVARSKLYAPYGGRP